MLDLTDFDPDRPDLFDGLTFIKDRDSVTVRSFHPYIAVNEVHCGFCDHRQKHRHGALIETDDDRWALCGCDCARDHLGIEVARKLRAGIARLERRRSNERALAPVAGGVGQVLAEIERWLPTERALDTTVSQMLIVAREIGLMRMITEAGTIDREDVEEFEVEFIRPDGSKGRRRDQKRQLRGRVHGVDVLRMRVSPLLSAGGKLMEIRRAIEAPRGKISDGDLHRLTRERSEAIGLLENGVRRFGLAQRFFEKENIRELGRVLVARDPHGPKIEWQARTIVLHPVAYDQYSRIPIEVAVPDFSKTPEVDGLIGPLRGSHGPSAHRDERVGRGRPEAMQRLCQKPLARTTPD